MFIMTMWYANLSIQTYKCLARPKENCLQKLDENAYIRSLNLAYTQTKTPMENLHTATVLVLKHFGHTVWFDFSGYTHCQRDATNAVGWGRQGKQDERHYTVYIHRYVCCAVLCYVYTYTLSNANDSTNGKLKSCPGRKSNASKIINIRPYIFRFNFFVCARVPFSIHFFIAHTLGWFVRLPCHPAASQPACPSYFSPLLCSLALPYACERVLCCADECMSMSMYVHCV